MWDGSKKEENCACTIIRGSGEGSRIAASRFLTVNISSAGPGEAAQLPPFDGRASAVIVLDVSSHMCGNIPTRCTRTFGLFEGLAKPSVLKSHQPIVKVISDLHSHLWSLRTEGMLVVRSGQIICQTQRNMRSVAHLDVRDQLSAREMAN